MIKSIIYALSVLAVLAVALSVFLQPNDLKGCLKGSSQPSQAEGCGAADAVIAISGGDTNARVNHAVQLLKDGWAEHLILSGAAEDKSGPSNALAMRNHAVSQGVDESKIIIEEYSHNTQENAQNTERLLEYYGINNVILVTSGYHQRRASIEFTRATESLQVSIRNSPTYDHAWGWYWWMTPRGWFLALSEASKSLVLMMGGGQ